MPNHSRIHEFLRAIPERLRELSLCLSKNIRGVTSHPPGHFYSPLLDLRALASASNSLPNDGLEMWEHVELREEEQKSYYTALLRDCPPLPFPAKPSAGFLYHAENRWFRLADAYTLSAILRRERPRRIIEVGSGFSSAVMLDTLRRSNWQSTLTLIEPNPQRLYSLLGARESSCARILTRTVQNVPVEVYDELEAGDVLFIDSSHVAKIGSDVTFLFLRVLPRLKPGVIIHVHDISFPESYPIAWVRKGWAWNESIMLRAFLVGNSSYQVMAFNAFARHAFPDLFRDLYPSFLQNPGGSFWMKKVG